MDNDRIFRRILWVSAAFNFSAAFVFAFPASALGRLVGLPADVPAVYSTMVALFVAQFGGSYAWLALQPVIHRPLVWFGVIGKSAVFVLAVILCISSEIPARLAAVSIADLVFAAIYLRWLLK